MTAMTKTIEELQKNLSLFANLTKEIPEPKKKHNKEEDIVEECTPIYKSKEVNFELPTMFRMSNSGKRWYFTVENDTPEGVKFHPSVTTVIQNTTPMSYGLQKILGEKGNDGFWQFMNEAADYGTFLHEEISHYLTRSEYNFDIIRERIDEYVQKKFITYDTSKWYRRVQKDLVSIMQFFIDHKVKPLLIEGVVKYQDKYGRTVAGAVDLLCKMTIQEKEYWGEVLKSGPNKGQPKETTREKEVVAIVDFKSGKNFFDDHALQLHMYKLAAEQSFGIPIDKIYNVGPVDFRDDPAYHIKDQTEARSIEKTPYMIAQFHIDFEGPKDVLVISGKKNGQDSLADICKKVPANDFVLSLPKVKKYVELLNKVKSNGSK